MPNIFISYRRDDSAGYAGRLQGLLSRQFRRGNVFMDVTSTPPGTDFEAALLKRIESSDTMIVLIGKRWLDQRDEHGNRRLDDPHDFVRLEIQTALERGLRIIPVLIDGAAMPAKASLPSELAALSKYQALSLGNERWHEDYQRLMDVLLPPRLPVRRIGFQTALVLLFLSLALITPSPKHVLREQKPEDVVIVGILPFNTESAGDSIKWLGDAFSTRVTDTLTSSNHVAVVSSRRILALAGSERDRRSLQRLAAAAGISYLLTGRIEMVEKSLRLIVRLIPAQMKSEEETWIYYGSVENLLKKATDIVARIRQEMGLPSVERIGVLAADFNTGDPEAYEAYVAGLQELMDFRYEEASRSFRASLHEDPEFIAAHYRLAQTYAVTGRTREATRLIREAERKVSSLLTREALYVRAAAHSINRNYPEALEAYRRLVESFPYDVEARQLYAQVLKDVGFYDEALREWEAIRALGPDLFTAWNFQADVHRLKGEPGAAISCLRKSLELDPNRPETHETLGNVYRSLGRFDEAAARYQEALRLNSGFQDARIQLAILRALQGRRNEAEQILEPIVLDTEVAPRFRIDAGFEHAFLLMAGGRFRAAGEILSSLEEELAGEGIREAMALSVRGMCALERGQIAQARDLISRSLARAPSSVTTRYLFARGLLELKSSDPDTARRTATEIRKLALPPKEKDRTEDKAADYLEGMALLAKGRALEALNFLKKASTRRDGDKSHEYCVYKLGTARALLAAGQLDEAFRVARKVASSLEIIEPRLDFELDRTRAHLLLAEIEQARGRTAEATAAAQQFLAAWQRFDSGHPDLVRARRLTGLAKPKRED